MFENAVEVMNAHAIHRTLSGDCSVMFLQKNVFLATEALLSASRPAVRGASFLGILGESSVYPPLIRRSWTHDSPRCDAIYSFC